MLFITLPQESSFQKKMSFERRAIFALTTYFVVVIELNTSFLSSPAETNKASLTGEKAKHITGASCYAYHECTSE